VLGNDSRDYGEPEAGAPGIPRPTLVESYEAIEHSLSVGHGDSGTVIGDNERRRRPRRAIPTGRRGLEIKAPLDGHGAVGVPACIVEEILHHPAQPGCIAKTRTGAIPVVSIFGGLAHAQLSPPATPGRRDRPVDFAVGGPRPCGPAKADR
jgi:hypothetical protein